MKILKNQSQSQKSFARSCSKICDMPKLLRATILSLFVMLTIPSISSGIFGSGDAMARCTGTLADALATSAASYCADAGSDTSACDAKRFTRLDTGANVALCAISNGTCVKNGTYTSTIAACANAPDSVCALLSGCSLINTANDNKLVEAVCRVYDIATGTAGKAFAAVGVISVGIGFFTGKVSWGLMISVAAGIAVFFGAPSIIAVISGDQSAAGLCTDIN